MAVFLIGLSVTKGVGKGAMPLFQWPIIPKPQYAQISQWADTPFVQQPLKALNSPPLVISVK